MIFILLFALVSTSGPLQSLSLFPQVAQANNSTPDLFGILRERDWADLATAAKDQGRLVPIGVSLTQSAYHTGDLVSETLVLTFTVTNHLPPLIRPDLDEDASFTDTVAALGAINPLDDPNTIRNVLLADELTANASFVAGLPTPDRQPLTRQLAWSLGDIAPLESVTATLTLQVTPAADGRIELDTAATAWGTHNGRAVSGQTCQAVLWAETLDGQPTSAWLPSSANSQSPEIVSRVCRGSPISTFEYVRTFDYEAYKGSLRGARGTEWSKAGNSLDQSTLLIAMLRSRGVPARYPIVVAPLALNGHRS